MSARLPKRGDVLHSRYTSGACDIIFLLEDPGPDGIALCLVCPVNVSDYISDYISDYGSDTVVMTMYVVKKWPNFPGDAPETLTMFQNDKMLSAASD